MLNIFQPEKAESAEEKAEEKVEILSEIRYKPEIEPEKTEKTAPVIEEIPLKNEEKPEISEFPSVFYDKTPEFTFQEDSSLVAHLTFFESGLDLNSIEWKMQTNGIHAKWRNTTGTRTVDFLFKFSDLIVTKESTVEKVINYVVFRVTKRENRRWERAGEFVSALEEVEEIEESRESSEPVEEKRESGPQFSYIQFECPLLYQLV